MKNRENMSAEDLRKESDWALFRERRQEWIGRYYTRLLAECVEDLYGPGTQPDHHAQSDHGYAGTEDYYFRRPRGIQRPIYRMRERRTGHA